MRRVVSVAVMVAIGALAIVGLLQLTKNRPDPIVRGSRSEIVLNVATKPPLTEDQAAASLWAVCLLRADEHRLVGQHRSDGDRVYIVAPALGEHASRRVVGCLEDATIERVLGDVREVRTRLPS